MHGQTTDKGWSQYLTTRTLCSGELKIGYFFIVDNITFICFIYCTEVTAKNKIKSELHLSTWAQFHSNTAAHMLNLSQGQKAQQPCILLTILFPSLEMFCYTET